jgi:hypothetical protein
VRRLMRRLHRWFRRRGGPAILMYHRIATPDVDPWGLSVSPKRFAEQVSGQADPGSRRSSCDSVSHDWPDRDRRGILVG